MSLSFDKIHIYREFKKDAISTISPVTKICNDLKLNAIKNEIKSKTTTYEEDCFKVLVMGGIGAGKTSLINAILGKMASQTVIESHTKNICKNYNDCGIMFIDTPGFYGDNSIEQEFIIKTMEKADAIIYVMDINRAFSKWDMELISELYAAGHKDLIFVINKMDYIEAEYRNKVIEVSEKFLSGYSILGKEAIQYLDSNGALRGKLDDNKAKAYKSGFEKLEEVLAKLLIEDKGKSKLTAFSDSIKLEIEMILKNIPSNVRADKNRTAEIESILNKVFVGLNDNVKRYGLLVASKAEKGQANNNRQTLDGSNPKPPEGNKRFFDYNKSKQRINNILDFTKNLLEIYKFDVHKKAKYFSEIKKVSARNSSEELYLGVLGEFSTGKSTFINALIRDNLLKKNVAGGTTSAPTIIRYGASSDVYVTFKNGKKEYFSKNNNVADKEAIISYIHRVTANEEVSKNVDEVVVYHPSTKLSEGLVIVDMPGISSLEKRHKEVTENTIREVCDAVIIVMHSVHHFTKTLEEFIQENLMDQIHRCIFIVNQIDLIEENEDRKLVFDSVLDKVVTDFKIKKPPLYCVSSLAMLNNDDTKKNLTSLKKSFEEMEESIIGILKQKKIFIQTEKTAAFLIESLKDITEELMKFENSYVLMHDALVKNRVPDIKVFVNERKSKYIRTLEDYTYNIKTDIVKALNTSLAEAKSGVSTKINACTSKDQLKNLIENLDTRLFNKIKEDIDNIITQNILKIENYGNSKIVEFEGDFTRVYQTLKTLGGKLDYTKNQAVAITKGNTIKTNSASAISIVNQSIDDAKGKRNIGVGVGIAFGIIFPGVGLLVGAILGGVVGKFFGKSLDDTKAECKVKIKASLDESFNKVQIDCMESINQSSGKAKGDIESRVFSYIATYHELLEEMDAKDKKMEQDLLLLQNYAKAHIKRLNEEIQWLTRLKEELLNY